jgi:hypothetical protein
MRQRTYGGVRGRGREASPTRSKECCTSGLISAQVRGILFVFVGAILALLLAKIPAVV